MKKLVQSKVKSCILCDLCLSEIKQSCLHACLHGLRYLCIFGQCPTVLATCASFNSAILPEGCSRSTENGEGMLVHSTCGHMTGLFSDFVSLLSRAPGLPYDASLRNGS